MAFDPTSLLHQYAALQPLHQLQISHSPLELARNQPSLVSSLITHPRLAEFPPAKTYQRGFWKIIVTLLEEGCRTEAGQEEELEVVEEIYEVYVDAMQQNDGTVGGGEDEGPRKPLSYKTFFFNAGVPDPLLGRTEVKTASLTLLESLLTIQAGTTGLRTWGASLRLAELLLAQPTILFPSPKSLKGMQRVLELGSGVGFLAGVVGVLGRELEVAAREVEESRQSGIVSGGQPFGVYATDLDANVLESLEGNVKLSAFGFFPFCLSFSHCACKPNAHLALLLLVRRPGRHSQSPTSRLG